MAFLIAVAGLSGAGKTTAVDHFRDLGLGRKVYLGETVLNEIHTRGLSATPENERAVRIDLRTQYGPEVLAARAASSIKQSLDDGVNVFLDAIFQIEEYQYLRAHCGNSTMVLLGIEASFEIRSGRLRLRAQRPLTSEELKVRDAAEISRLGTGNVIANANHKVLNEGTIQSFRSDLEKIWTVATGLSCR
jgi:dephospho-CoA kinase